MEYDSDDDYEEISIPGAVLMPKDMQIVGVVGNSEGEKFAFPLDPPVPVKPGDTIAVARNGKIYVGEPELAPKPPKLNSKVLRYARSWLFSFTFVTAGTYLLARLFDLAPDTPWWMWSLQGAFVATAFLVTDHFRKDKRV